MYVWSKSEERLNRYARLLQGESLTIHVYYWGAVPKLVANAVHKHSFFEVCYVAGGTGIYEEGGTAYPLHEGVLFCSRPNIRHQIKDVDQLDLLYVAYELDEKLSKPDEFEYYNQSLNSGPIWMENQQHSPTAHIWKSLLIPSEEMFAVPIALLNQLAHALILTFPTIVGGRNKNTEIILPASNAAILISRAKLYIRDNLGANLSLSEVARYINVSERHLSRLFHKAFMNRSPCLLDMSESAWRSSCYHKQQRRLKPSLSAAASHPYIISLERLPKQRHSSSCLSRGQPQKYR